MYQEGRAIVDARLRRAYRKKTRTGRGAQFGMWMEHEFETLKALHAAGADVPRPFSISGPAVLMEYVGDERSPAPTLNRVSLSREEAHPLSHRLMRNIGLMLSRNRVHADLSAFNVLHWKGGIRIIDFPQAVDPRFNRNALFLLTRDIGNVCGYFRRHGVEADPSRLARSLWSRFLRSEL